MKTLRVIAATVAMSLVFALSVSAAPFTPSVERKDAPEIVEGDEDLIITPVSDLYDEETDLHEDIEKSLTDAEKELAEKTLEELVENFEKIWEEATKGAPVDHAVISDIFDVRLTTDLGDGEGIGIEISFKLEILGLDKDDLFILLTKESADAAWVILDYEISDDGIITIKTTSKSVIVVVKDNEAPPAVDPDGPDSPATAVRSYVIPAVVCIVVLGAIAAICINKISKSREIED